MSIFTLSKTKLSFLESKGMANCWAAYALNTPNREIIEVVFNERTKYIYIALENMVTIASNNGNAVEYLIFDEDGKELSFDEYDEAVLTLNK